MPGKAMHKLVKVIQVQQCPTHVKKTRLEWALKYSFSEKATKISAIFLKVLTSTT